MSKIALQGDASGTGTFTIAAPNSNSNPTLTLPTSSGTVVVTGGAQTIEFAAGSAASPSITFTGDTNTGIFSPGADTIAFSEGGVESMRIDSSGNVGIGTSSPPADTNLTVLGNFNSGFYRNVTSGARGYFLNIGAKTSTGFADGAYIFGAVDSGDATGYLTFGTRSGGATAERMRITSAGQVGIGTSSPATIGSNYGALDIRGSGGGGLTFGVSSGFAATMYATGSSFDILTSSAGDIRFFNKTSTGESARITSDGKLLVGSTSVFSSGNVIEAYRSSGNCYIGIKSNSVANGEQALCFIAAGTKYAGLGVYKHSGITNSAAYLNLDTEDGVSNYLWPDNSDVLRISTVSADIGTTNGTVVGTQTSDERLKDINGLVSYGLNEVLLLEPISFAFKDRPDVQKIGFSAQQVQPIVPEAVYDTKECIDGYETDPENRMLQTPKSDRTKLAMEYTQLIPVLVNAVKELKAITDAQVTRIEALEAEVAALKGQ